jgi:membrane protease YdiL (CAAX protease family)
LEPQPPYGGEPSASPGNADTVLSSAGGEVGLPPQSSRFAENPPWNAWDVVAILGLAVVTILVSQFAILFGAQYLLYPRARLVDLAQRPILLLISQFVIDASIVAYLLLLVEGKYHQPFWRAIRWNWPKQTMAMLGLGTATYLVLATLGSLLPMPKETPFDKLFESRRDAYLLAIIATTLGPLMEELFFRGFFYPVVAKRWGAGWGIFLAALPFALVHMQQYGYSWGILLLIFGVGVVCGIVRAYTGSVGASFLVHAGYNGAQMVLAVILTHGFTRMPKG